MSESDNNSCPSNELFANELLEYCESDTISEDGIHEIIQRHKESSSDDRSSHDVCDYVFFHQACYNEKVTEGIIRCLLEYFPDAVNYLDDDGKLPLHYACGNCNVSMGVIQLLIDADPDSVRFQSNYGHVPLHCLCANSELDEATALEILKLILETYPESVHHVNSASLLPIQVAARHIMTKSHEFYSVLIDADPGSEQMDDEMGMLPLNYACMHNTVEAVEYWYNVYPDAINHVTRDGLYPIHTAIGNLSRGGTNHHPISFERNDKIEALKIVKFLLRCNPDVKFQEVLEGETLLHYACRCGQSNTMVALGIIEAIYDAHPEFIRKVDNSGQLPLHKLCGKVSQDNEPDMAILRFLLEKYPQSIRHADNDGDLPIHIAVMAKPYEFCRVLIDVYPGSERITGSMDMLPFNKACMRSSFDIVEYLYNLYPDAIDHPVAAGIYPIHCAIHRVTQTEDPEAAVAIVKFLLDCDPRVKFQKAGGFATNLIFVCHQGFNDTNIVAGIKIIMAIFDADPEAIGDDMIASNLHSSHPAVQAFINSQLVYFRRAKDEDVMTTPDESGRLPLHTALQINSYLGSIKLLVKGNPLAVQTPDNDGTLPLHIACICHKSTIVQYLIELDTTSLNALDEGNDTPLHYACHGAKYETIALLLEKYDAVSVSKRNAEGKLPIEVLWENDELVDRGSLEYTECLFRLLRAYPETVMSCL